MDDALVERTNIVAESICETVFHQTRHACLLAIEHGKRIIGLSKLARDNPEYVVHLENIFDALQLRAGEILLERAMIDEVAKRFAPLLAEARAQERERCAKVIRERLYPKNPPEDWTEFAVIQAEAAEQAVQAIRSDNSGGEA